MSPNTKDGLASYFEEKRQYDEEDMNAVVEFLAKRRAMQEKVPDRAHTESKHPDPEDVQDSRSIPSAELKAILRIFSGEKATQSQTESNKREAKTEETNGQEVP